MQNFLIKTLLETINNNTAAKNSGMRAVAMITIIFSVFLFITLAIVIIVYMAKRGKNGKKTDLPKTNHPPYI